MPLISIPVCCPPPSSPQVHQPLLVLDPGPSPLCSSVIPHSDTLATALPCLIIDHLYKRPMQQLCMLILMLKTFSLYL